MYVKQNNTKEVVFKFGEQLSVKKMLQIMIFSV